MRVHTPAMIRRLLPTALLCLTLCQCDSLRNDCRALAAREAEIAAETPGAHYIGRRYYLPGTRFWGYLRKPGQSWRTAQLVIMDEQLARTPDRGLEPPVKGAVFGRDKNVEYYVYGSYTGEKAYDPSTDQVLPIFQAREYKVRNPKPGFLFIPSEQYSPSFVTLVPRIMPQPSQCSNAQ